jgi:hypothetical protein
MNTKVLYLLLIVFILSNKINAQSTQQMFWALNQSPQYLLDIAAPTSNASFAYSLRKLRRAYNGFSIKVRRGTDNAEGNIAFDAAGIVSTNSNVTVTAKGSSTLTVGSVINFNTFKGIQQLFVTTWYDQGFNAYNAVQTATANQPELTMNTAAGGLKPSISFNGSYYLVINQPIENIVSSGLSGTFLLALKTTINSAQFAFGYRNSATDWRWTMHLNWSDGNCYFDAAEVCCATYRSFNNSANVNFWKQYSFIRGTGYKTIRVSDTTKIDSAAAPSITQTGGQFYIGYSYGISSGLFQGFMSEVLMFPKNFPLFALKPLEYNQINYWKL